jgi:hypothetical protein
LLPLLVVPAVDAARKTKKAGKITGNVFNDSKFNYSLTLNDEWKARVRKDKESFRLVLTQKNYGIPTRFQDQTDYTQVPRIVIYADTCSLGPSAFLDSLLSSSFKSKQKSEITKEFDILNEQEVIPKGKKTLRLNGNQGRVWSGLSKYVKNIQRSSTSIGSERVYGGYGACIAVVKHDQTLVLFHLICEEEYFPELYEAALGFVNSLAWPDETKEG